MVAAYEPTSEARGMDRPAYLTVLVSTRAPGVASIVLNRPERKNALHPVLINELIWALDEAAADEEIRAIVLAGAGTTFCAGADLAPLAVESTLPVKGEFADLLLRIYRSPKPVIARVSGHAMGGGLGLVAACHFAIGAESARLGTPEIRRGLFPMQIMTMLTRVMDRRHLLEMMLLGEPISAADGVRYGLLNQAVPDLELETAVTALADRLAGQSPTAMRLGLAALVDQEGQSPEAVLPMLRDRFQAMFATEDAREGLAAFAEKRAPRWTGR